MNQSLGVTNSPDSPIDSIEQKNKMTNRFGPVDLAAFWSLPIAPVALLADVLSTSPQGIGRMGFPTYRIGSGLYVRPVDVAHNFRALKPEVSK